MLGKPTRKRRLAVIASTTSAVLAVSLVGVQALAAPAKSESPAAPAAKSTKTLTKRATELLATMSLTQKRQMLDGANAVAGTTKDYAGYIPGIASLDIPPLYLADGAVGDGNGSTGVTQWPSGLSDAATF